LLAAGDGEGLLAIEFGTDRDPLAATPRMNLRLDDDQAAAQGVERGPSLFGGRHDEARRDGDAGLLEQLFGLVFVDFHRRTVPERESTTTHHPRAWSARGLPCVRLYHACG